MGKQEIHASARRVLDPLVRLLVRMGVSPAALTGAGFVISVVAGLSIVAGRHRWAGILLGVGAVCDTLDGPVARLGGKASKLGAFLDSTIDRYAEVAVFVALAFWLRGDSALLSILLALSGSLLVSYTRARAEGLGEECRVGILERPERLALLIIGLLAGRRATEVVVWFIAIFAHVTAAQRIAHVARRTRAAGPIRPPRAPSEVENEQ